MAKRLTDTAKWDMSWFRKLDPKLKCAWLFLCDRCNHAGIWEVDEDAFAYYIGEGISFSEVLDCLKDRISFIKDDKIFIKSFIDFQYGELNPINKVHKSVISILEKNGATMGLGSPIQGAKVKEKALVKDKVKEKVKDKDQDLHPMILLWNSAASNLGSVVKSNSARDKKIKNLWDQNSPEEWLKIIQLINQSDFCTGKNDRNWKATFDWLLQPEVYLKVLEGKYDNRTRPNTKRFANERDHDQVVDEFNIIASGIDPATGKPLG